MLFLSVFLLLVLPAVVSVCLWRLHGIKQRLKDAETQRQEVLEHQRSLNVELAELRGRVEKGEWMDGLTGLPSRQIFEDRLVLAIGQSTRYKLTCAVMFLNLDHFRIVNDALGLQAGDFILKKVAGRLNECVRELDTVSRFAGDEFVMLFPQINRAETAGYIAQRVLDRISQPYDVEGEDVWLTASVGIAVFPLDGENAGTLIQNAENALHQAKAHGRNTYQFYRKEMHALGKRELMLGAGLHNELLFHEFAITYLPEVDVKSRQITCMDVQLHWHHPDFGPVPLSEFVHLAENTGRIVDIGEWVMRTVVQDLLAWREQGLPMVAVSLPLSLKQLEKMHFVHFLSTLLQEFHLDPDIFIFEITDTAGLVHIDAVKKMLDMMKHLGVRLSINGLGTDNLSIRRLYQLPMDVFKLDAQLVKNITHDSESRAIAKMIIALARSLNAGIVALGVENLGQETVLLEMGCKTLQGNLFSQSLAGHQFTKETVREICEGMAQPVS